MFKTSILVEKQLPSFISEENTKFVKFLESYYKFMEVPYGQTSDSTNVTSDNLSITVDRQ